MLFFLRLVFCLVGIICACLVELIGGVVILNTSPTTTSNHHHLRHQSIKTGASTAAASSTSAAGTTLVQQQQQQHLRATSTSTNDSLNKRHHTLPLDNNNRDSTTSTSTTTSNRHHQLPLFDLSSTTSSYTAPSLYLPEHIGEAAAAAAMTNSNDSAAIGGDGDNSNRRTFGIDDTTVWLLFWILSLALFLIVPCCLTKQRRSRCYRRIKERRWNVIDENDDEASLHDDEWYWNMIRTSQQEINDINREIPGYRVSPKQEDEIRDAYLTQKLSRYSMALDPSAIKLIGENDNDAEGYATSAMKQQGKRPDEVCSETEETASYESFSHSSPAGADDDDSSSGSSAASSLGDHKHSSRLLVLLPSGSNTENRTNVYVPKPGFCLPKHHHQCYSPPQVQYQQLLSNNKDNIRLMPNGCAVCMGVFFAHDKITWSANPSCPHVFHHRCMMQWLNSVGKTELQRMRQTGQRSTTNPLRDIVTFPMLCPCCRQSFVVNKNNNNSTKNKNQENNETTTTTTATPEEEQHEGLSLVPTTSFTSSSSGDEEQRRQQTPSQQISVTTEDPAMEIESDVLTNHNIQSDNDTLIVQEWV